MQPYQDRDWLYQQYWTNGFSTPEIAKRFGYGHGTIHTWLKKLGIPTRSIRESQRGKKKCPCTDAAKKKISERVTAYRAQFLKPKPYHNREWLYQKYVVEKLSPYKIANLCDDYGQCVWHWIEKFKLDRRNRSEAVKEHYRQNPDAALAGSRNPQYGTKRTPEDKERLSRASRANWNNPAYVNKVLAGCHLRPSRPEKVFQSLAPDNVYYVGDGRWWKRFTNGKYKNPDFKVRGQNKVIEIYGKYWHRNDRPQELIDEYRTIGIDCLIIWEQEIYNNPEEVCLRAKQFASEVA